MKIVTQNLLLNGNIIMNANAIREIIRTLKRNLKLVGYTLGMFTDVLPAGKSNVFSKIEMWKHVEFWLFVIAGLALAFWGMTYHGT